MTFYQWLLTQVERDDIVGEFAHAVSQIDDEPQMSRHQKKDSHKVWADWLLRHKASEEVLAAFNMAWKVYQQTLDNVGTPPVETEAKSENSDDTETATSIAPDPGS